ncbi:hypothetical protein N7454_006295 [Penicillium verhagenii]|nr:hypothetical protein N7454_006295 [Penicillium verhagenii]
MAQQGSTLAQLGGVKAAVTRRSDLSPTLTPLLTSPIYYALTLLTPGRATLERLSPISHPSGTHRTTGRI